MRYVARVANTGITQIIDPLGRVVRSLASGRPDVLAGEVYPIYRKTFYTKNGPAIVWAVNIIVAISLFIPKKRC
jgi:apolipoprotein N-acyltransferase